LENGCLARFFLLNTGTRVSDTHASHDKPLNCRVCHRLRVLTQLSISSASAINTYHEPAGWGPKGWVATLCLRSCPTYRCLRRRSNSQRRRHNPLTELIFSVVVAIPQLSCWNWVVSTFQNGRCIPRVPLLSVRIRACLRSFWPSIYSLVSKDSSRVQRTPQPTRLLTSWVRCRVRPILNVFPNPRKVASSRWVGSDLPGRPYADIKQHEATREGGRCVLWMAAFKRMKAVAKAVTAILLAAVSYYFLFERLFAPIVDLRQMPSKQARGRRVAMITSDRSMDKR